MTFRITGLSPSKFTALFGASEEQLRTVNAERVIADADRGFPDRITLAEAKKGQSLLLINYEHQPARSPYKSRHAIYVVEEDVAPFDEIDTVPEVLATRFLSLRGFDAKGKIAAAELCEGADCASAIVTLFAEPEVAYIHAHFAARGCYGGLITRA